jgi:hypothetical protein
MAQMSFDFTPNHALQRTQHFVVALSAIHRTAPKCWVTRASTIAAIVSALAAAAPAQTADRPFDVSLSEADVMNLSPIYQQVIREATDAYRGDFPSYFVFTARTVVSRFSYPSTRAINAPLDLQEGSDPFPQVPFTLSCKPDVVTTRR